MAGAKGRSGGRRPGAGRKSEDLQLRQGRMREIFHEVVTEDGWRACVGAVLALAREGNVAAFKELAPWIVGRVPEAHDLNLRGGVVIELPDRAIEP